VAEVHPATSLGICLHHGLIQGWDEKLNSEIGAIQSNSITMLKNELQNRNSNGVNDHPARCTGGLPFST